MWVLLAIASLLLGSVSPVAVAAEAEAVQAPDGGELRLGQVNFKISCTQAAQAEFNQAAAILHSFWYEEAVKAFTVVTETDPACAMGYWGVAMSWWYPLWSPPDQAALQAGTSAVAKARAIGGKTDRENDYISAIATFYQDRDKIDHRSRSLAYEKAMQALHEHYPEDREAAVFYALALDATALPTDKSFANQKKAAGILQAVFAEQPNHPGVAHYLIHSYDSAPLAELGLPAAICYGQIAPSVPHALHMPSHIFTRLGKWRESIDSNRQAADAGQAYAMREFGPGVAWGQSLHAMDYLEYAYLQLAEDGAAKQLVDQIAAFQKVGDDQMASAFAITAVSARYAVERRDWIQAASITIPPIAFPWEGYPQTTAMISFARALGAAHTGDIAAARNEIDHLQSARDALTPKAKYWADQVEVQRLAALAVLARAEGRNDDALAQMRKAVDLEASMDKSNVTPGAVAPTHELMGDLLLELDQATPALSEYEQSLGTAPNRFRSLYGAAKAADRSGDATKAKTYYRQLAELGIHADTDRPELAEAKAYLRE